MSSLLPERSTVLITGATGFTGRVLTRRLVAEGHQVRAIARASSTLGDLESLNLTWYRGDVYEPDLIQQAMQGVNYVFHIATLFRDGGANEEEHRKVHVDSTRLLAQAAVAQPSFKRFVHMSTVGVHGHIEEPPADELAPFKPGDEYQRTKLEAEEWLGSHAGDLGLEYTILRPAAIYGPEDKRLLKLFRMALKKRYILIGNGKCLYHLIHVEDLVDLMMRAAVSDNAPGEAFICGNPEAMTLMDLGQTVAETLGHPFKPLRIPAGPVFLLADLCEVLCKPFGITPPIYRRRVAFFTKDRSFDTRKIQKAFDWSPSRDNQTGVRETALAYREAGWL